ncbi:hypothetical protein C7S20_19485 [Christiangramia fulva]|uniref:Uncharacterized protein n=1 Tax=Christiangramia fulva TaxID=2126553 RepID=A0A2R3ZAF3_9FLAO|nr:hypothetical protein [Christiangramia fulva]AVR47259.1 hypothetical protein C7S20_19485 [Christiangramia fulva]
MDRISTIEPKIGFTFKANKVNYVIEDRLSIARAIEANKLELDLFDISTSTLKKSLIAVYNDLNGNNKERAVKFADAAAKVHNLVNGLEKNLKFQEAPVLRYCALYINAEGEDRRTIDEERITKKINDWQEGGYDFQGFFLLVLSVLPSVRKDYIRFIQDISKESQPKESPKKEA